MPAKKPAPAKGKLTPSQVQKIRKSAKKAAAKAFQELVIDPSMLAAQRKRYPPLPSPQTPALFKPRPKSGQSRSTLPQ